jgi:hypothetical protein
MYKTTFNPNWKKMHFCFLKQCPYLPRYSRRGARAIQSWRQVSYQLKTGTVPDFSLNKKKTKNRGMSAPT